MIRTLVLIVRWTWAACWGVVVWLGRVVRLALEPLLAGTRR